MVSFIKIEPFLNSAALGGPGGKMAPPGRRRPLEAVAWCQNVRTNILVTEVTNGAPSARHFRTIKDFCPGGGGTTPPIPTKG